MKSVYFIFGILLCAACTQYQYITLNSDVYRQDDQHFVWENDTVSIQYIFSGAYCPLTVHIYNKMGQPLYVDWKKSAVVYGDGSRFALWSDQAFINTATVGGSVRFGNVTMTGSQTGGVVGRSEQVSFVPPASYASLRPVAVRSSFIQPLPPELKRKVPFGDVDDSNVDKYTFTPNNSPFTFRCFLTLSTTDNFEKPIYVDQSFWVSDIIQTTIGPNRVMQADNMFYVNRTTTMGHIMGGVGVMAIVAGAVYLDAATAPPPPAMYHRHGRR